LTFSSRFDPSKSSSRELPSITNGAEQLMETAERTTATSAFLTETDAAVEVPIIVKQSLNFVSSVPLQHRTTVPTISTET
jgi:hypothetical protein